MLPFGYRLFYCTHCHYEGTYLNKKWTDDKKEK